LRKVPLNWFTIAIGAGFFQGKEKPRGNSTLSHGAGWFLQLRSQHRTSLGAEVHSE
jgi:hypothetical protein